MRSSRGVSVRLTANATVLGSISAYSELRGVADEELLKI
jgi:hypothetical protein